MTYRESGVRKAARLRKWADKRNAKGNAILNNLESTHPEIHDWAFITQPGIGHLRAKINRIEERGWENINKGAAMDRRASGIEYQLAESIYSDDTDAVARLRERIAGLESERDRIKAYNTSCRALKTEHGDLLLLDDAQRANLLACLRHQAWACKNGAFPAYVLTNLSGNIKRQKDRLAELSRPSEQDRGRFLSALRRAGLCRECGTELAQGAPAIYYRATQEIACYPPCTGEAEQ